KTPAAIFAIQKLRPARVQRTPMPGSASARMNQYKYGCSLAAILSAGKTSLLMNCWDVNGIKDKRQYRDPNTQKTTNSIWQKKTPARFTIVLRFAECAVLSCRCPCTLGCADEHG